MDQDKLFNLIVSGFVGSWVSGVNAFVKEKKPIPYGLQLVVSPLDEEDSSTVAYVNVFNSKKGVRISIQCGDEDLLNLVRRNIPEGIVSEDTLQRHQPVYV